MLLSVDNASDTPNIDFISSKLFILLNIRSMLNKMSNLRSFIILSKPLVLLITETWLKPDISDLTVAIDHYHCYRCDRTFGGGGGTAIYVHSSVHSTQVNIISHVDPLEHCWVSIFLKNNVKLLVGCVYRSPNNASKCDSVLAELFNSASQLPFDMKFIGGDFNLPELYWDSKHFPSGLTNLSNALDCGHWQQHIKTPTRMNSILDLIFTSGIKYISTHVGEHFYNSDHRVVSCNLHLNTTYRTKFDILVKRNYSRFNDLNVVDNMRDLDWSTFLLTDQVEDCGTHLYSNFTSILDRNAPQELMYKSNTPGYLTTAIRRKLRRLCKLYHSTNSFCAIVSIKRIMADVELRWSKTIRNRESNALNCIDSSKQLSNLFKQKCSAVNKNISCLIDSDSKKILSDPRDICNALSMHFSTCFSEIESTVVLPSSSHVNNSIISIASHDKDLSTPILSHIDFDCMDIVKIVKSLKPSYSLGPDNINSILIKACLPDIAPLLSKLFSLSLAHSTYPDLWKTTFIKPLFKSGSRMDVNNYRPINITSILSRIMEKIVKSKLTSHLSSNNLINESQHGFTKSKSCDTCLVEFFDYVSCLKDINYQVIILYFDFSKAFDTVSHSLLLEKLSQIGISDPLLKWFRSFLSNRNQVTHINNVSSCAINVSSGVIQGSVLGPLLFLIYINDITKEILNGRPFLYADDLKIVYSSDTMSVEFISTIQQDLIRLDSWCNNWKMKLNAPKCGYMNLNKVSSPLSLYLNGLPLKPLDHVKDLGLTYTKTLSFHEHISSITSKANRISGFIQRNFFLQETKVALFKMFVRPRLEYCSFIFSNLRKSEIINVERVQRNFTRRLIVSDNPVSYISRCQHLKLKPFWLIRLKKNMILFYKYLHKLCLSSTSIYLCTTPLHTTRNSCTSVQIRTPKSHFRANFFLVRYTSIWNRLPIPIRECKTLSKFVKLLDDYLCTTDCMSLLTNEHCVPNMHIGPGNI